MWIPMGAGRGLFLGRFLPFKRKLLSLIFGIRNNEFEAFITHHISVQIK